MNTENLMFDPTYAEHIAEVLTGLGLPAVVDHYEIGMAQVRLDPANGGPTGHVAVAGSNNEGQDRWVLIDTIRLDDGTYDTTGAVTDLGLTHTVPPDVVVGAIWRGVLGDDTPIPGTDD